MTDNPWKPSARQRAPAKLMEPLCDPAGWHPDDLKGTDAWVYNMSEPEVAEVLDAVSAVEATGTEIKHVTRDNFPLPGLSAALADIREEVMNGRGFAMIRGLPMEGRSRLQTAIAFWGIGSYFARAVSQNGKGHLLGHVKDLGGDMNSTSGRAYHSGGPIGFHADRCDILSLCCLHGAKSGGQHRIVSSVTIYNEMLKTQPDLVKEMTFRFYRSRRGELPPGATNPWVRQPVFSVKDGYFSARGASSTIIRGQKFPGVPKLTPAQWEAFELYDELGTELALDLDFRPGDISFVLNHVTLHCRSDYQDWPEPERKRHLLRLWLNTDGARPLHAEVAREIQGVVVKGTVLETPLEAA